jgi:hypothetical protein
MRKGWSLAKRRSTEPSFAFKSACSSEPLLLEPQCTMHHDRLPRKSR